MLSGVVEQQTVLSVLVADDGRSVLDVLEALIGAEEGPCGSSGRRPTPTTRSRPPCRTNPTSSCSTCGCPEVAGFAPPVRSPVGAHRRAVMTLTAHEDEDTVISR